MMIKLLLNTLLVLSSLFFQEGGQKMTTVNLSLQILPVVPENQVYPVVDQVIEHIKASGFPYIVGPMETTLEGDLKSLLKLVEEAQMICTRAGASRVITVVKIDYKPDGVTMDEKISKYQAHPGSLGEHPGPSHDLGTGSQN